MQHRVKRDRTLSWLATISTCSRSATTTRTSYAVKRCLTISVVAPASEDHRWQCGQNQRPLHQGLEFGVSATGKWWLSVSQTYSEFMGSMLAMGNSKMYRWQELPTSDLYTAMLPARGRNKQLPEMHRQPLRYHSMQRSVISQTCFSVCNPTLRDPTRAAAETRIYPLDSG